MNANAPEPGTILAGKYQVEQVLGVGGMGAVVAAHHIQLDQKVAIKYLLPEALQNAEAVARFGREARAAAKIKGQHVARVIDVGQFEDGAPFMVMEYLEGHDLAKELETKGPLAVTDTVRYILEACSALAEAHAAKIVHRDLKPSNLFLAKQPDKRSIIKVLDFGISKVEGTGAGSGNLTKTSAFMGTAYYMSPEQMMTPKLVDSRSDIWALGIIMYELLSGVTPFRGETMPEVVGAILANRPVPLRELRPDLPLGLDAVIASCMQTQQDQRPPSVATLAEAIGEFAAAHDRKSIEISRRVLGDFAGPPGESSSRVYASDGSPVSATNATMAVTPATPFQPQTPPHGVPLSTGFAPEGLAASVNQPVKRTPVVAIVAGLLFAVGGISAATFAFTRRADPPSTGGAGLVTAVTANAPSNNTAVAPTVETLPPLAALPAAPLPSNRVEEVAPAAGVAGGKPRDRGRARPAASVIASAAPVVATPPAAAQPTPPASAAAPVTAPPNGQKNPLQMGIK